MATKSERNPAEKSAFSVVTLAGNFLRESGVTPEQIQAIRESPKRIEEFRRLAKNALQEKNERLAELQLGGERAVNIGGRHYHLVLLPLIHLFGHGSAPESLVSDAVAYEALDGRLPLSEPAYPNAEQVVNSVSSPGLWLAWTDYGGLVVWERTTEGVQSKGSYGRAEGIRFAKFEGVLGMIFMYECPDCDHIDQSQG